MSWHGKMRLDFFTEHRPRGWNRIALRQSMSTPAELWKKWEGRVVDEKFPLRQWLGGSEHSAVFLTERTGGGSQKAAVKLIAAKNLGEEAQLSRWAAAAKFSHPHVIRLFDCGRCVIDGTPLLYLVMEHADETLAEILPLRALSPEEASEMLKPAAEALASLHRSGLAHGGIKPSNIMAVDIQLKLSADSIRKIGERDAARAPSVYDAPEMATNGPAPASDIWAVGAALVAVLTQNEPKVKNGDRELIDVPSTIPQPLRDIVQKCLRVDPAQRSTTEDILRRLQSAAPASAEVVQGPTSPQRLKRPAVIVPIVATVLLFLALFGLKYVLRRASNPAAQTTSASLPAGLPATQSPAPFSVKQQPAQKGKERGSVLQQAMPEVSHSAQNTITGRFRVSVQVAVDASGNVSEAKLVSAGPSRYFADRALAAARRWKFAAPHVGGQAATSEWLLRFQFSRASIQAFPSQTKP